MKIVLFLIFLITADNNKFSEVIITPKAMFFKHKDKDLWTIQTLNRNFQVYDLFVVKGSADSIVEKNNIPFKFYTDTITEIKFSPWTSNIFKDTVNIRDIDSYNSNRNLGLRDKVSMVAYMNRKTFPEIENFFSKTFRIGNKSISTSLDKPINIIDYKDGDFLFYHNRTSIVCVTKNSGQELFSKSDYTWNYTNKKLYLYPKEDYIKRKPINAIKNGRSWYNTNWEKMRKEGKLFAYYDQSGLKWNTSDLTDNEKNLVSWFKKN